MYMRALIVLLLAMNLGVALWWALRPAPGPAPAPELPAGVQRLVLVSEAASGDLQPAAPDASGGDSQADGAAAAEVAEVDFESLQCFSLGPWADAGEAEPALATLQDRVEHARAREVPTGAVGWRVMLPPQDDREAAQAMVARLVEAGFQDHFIIAQGEEANAVALGRFGSEPGARRHEQALRAAGFEAVAEPLGATGGQTWIDFAAGGDFDVEQAREDVGATQAGTADCNLLQ